MKKFLPVFVLIMLLMPLAAGCQKKEEVPDEPSSASSSEKEDVPVISPGEEEGPAPQEEGGKDSQAVEDKLKDELEGRTLTCVEENFLNSSRYISSSADKARVLNYSLEVYSPLPRTGKEKYSDVHRDIIEKSSGDTYKKIRYLRADKNGSTIDVGVFMDPDSLYIDRIVTEEYCADAREITDYCFIEGKLVYAYQYLKDVYATECDDESLPGKKCCFADERMTGCIIDDADVDFRKRVYEAASYDRMDEFSKAQYDELEKDMLRRAYITYETVRSVPGFALIYGYVGDEFGGYLSNVHMTVRSAANRYESTFETNGDGYFETMVPINTDDRYGLVCEYGDYTISTVDDIDIVPGTLEYCLGVIYMAEPGKGVHDANTYLLNANYVSPKHLGDGELCVVFDYEDKSADLKCFALDQKSGRLSSDAMAVIKPGKDGRYKYYVTDQRGGRSGNPMTYEMSTSRAYVRVYDVYGLRAAYQVPAGKAGTVWEVFGTMGGNIYPINNYLIRSGGKPFFD